jgi:peptidoglycan LD-endopeptidase LytH
MKILMMLLLLAMANPADRVEEWDHFEKSVRDQTIRKEEAQKRFPPVYNALKEVCSKHPFKQRSSWQFPVQGYGVKDIGAGGFQPGAPSRSSSIKGYVFYDGNRHGGHPAYDIFIHDQNQDSRDDRTRKPATVIAPVDLLILSVERKWESNSDLRGGRYIWALDPLHDRIFYFAHLNEILADAGAFYPSGSAIGTVGRTGKNASPRRSPTHLHFMVLEIEEANLLPFDYRSLLK